MRSSPSSPTTGTSRAGPQLHRRRVRTGVHALREFREPLRLHPGDNEWTDCHRLPNPSPEEAYPLNRLALVRQTFFSDGYPLGQKEIPLQRQSEDYPENARWRYGDVTFATLHVVGSNNNRPTTAHPTVGNEEEWRARNEANIAWLKETFDAAEPEQRGGDAGDAGQHLRG